MLEFLREDELAPRFRALTKKAAEVIIAVPFWGDGAVKMLGLKKGRVLCNLASTACNPYVIEKLKELRQIKVRSNPRLHAKIYATRTFVIIGSSNASKRGLTIEGEMSDHWIEANVLSDDQRLVSETISLFEEIWKSQETVPVNATRLREAKHRWDNRPRPLLLGRAKATTLLEACRKNPELFSSVFVAAYEEPLGQKGEQLLSDLRKRARPPERGLKARDLRNAWGYQLGKRIKPGSWLVDLDCRNPDRPRVWGCCQTVFSLKVRGEPDLEIANRGVVQLPGLPPLRVSSAEKRALIANSRRILKHPDSFVPLVKVVDIIDRSKKVPKVHA